ncbi:MAG: ABC transporter permease [Microthrixaceae bacterium]|jgi:peptide/nickel transport system permease protein|nr:ABC transporter permease [Actinomycetota bacterium]MBP6730302.1 ABC transporter permease [Microthrixaceae bacterium]
MSSATERRTRLGVGGIIALTWVSLVLLLAVAGPLLPLPDPSRQAPCATKQPKPETGPDGRPVEVDGRVRMVPQPGCSFQQAADDRPGAQPSPAHAFGTDQIGRDLLSRVVAGSRNVAIIAFGSVMTAIVIGGSIGMASAFVGGRVDQVVAGLSAATLAIPGIVLAIALVGAFGKTLFSVWLAITIGAIPILVLVTRTQAASLITREFVEASRMLGAKPSRVLVREVMPNVAPFALVFLGLGVALAIGAESGLAILGLAPDGSHTWGAIIASGTSRISDAPHIALIPAAVMTTTIWAVNRLADHVSARLGIRGSLL